MKLKSIFLSLLLLAASTAAHAKINVVTATEDLAALTREVGGDLVKVESIAKGYQDPHFVEAKPSYLLKLKRADLFIQVGLELETAWAPALLTNARNPKILPGQTGFMDASDGCEILQKFDGRVDRSMGDIHPFGNPHYWLDPANGRVIARRIAEKLSVLDPDNQSTYDKNLTRFEDKLAAKESQWKKLNVSVVTYHNSWPNFAKRFGLKVVNYIEPKPGIPPSPAHIQALIEQIRAEKIPVILVEPYFDLKLPKKIASETGARLIVFPSSVGAEKEIKTYIDLFDHNVSLLKNALEEL